MCISAHISVTVRNWLLLAIIHRDNFVYAANRVRKLWIIIRKKSVTVEMSWCVYDGMHVHKTYIPNCSYTYIFVCLA